MKNRILIYTVLFLSFVLVSSVCQAGWVLPAESQGDAGNCVVTWSKDNTQNSDVNSFRRKVEQGFNNSSSSACKKSIRLKTNITLSDELILSGPDVPLVIEGVEGQNIRIDVSRVSSSCALTVESNQIILRNVTITGAKNTAVCWEGSQGRIEAVTFDGNDEALSVSGTNNVITKSNFKNSSGIAVRLLQQRNYVSENNFFGNTENILSPLTAATPEVIQMESLNASDSRWKITFDIDDIVNRVEAYAVDPKNGQTYLGATNTVGLFQSALTIDVDNGKYIYLVAFVDQMTAQPTEDIQVSEVFTGNGGGGNNGNSGGSGFNPQCNKGRPLTDDEVPARNCHEGIGSPEMLDTDCDGIKDNIEDPNLDCRFQQGETDPTSSDTDGDGIYDGVEDANLDGVWQEGLETNPRLVDTDGDFIADGDEDRTNHGFVDSFELDPKKKDTDDDGIPDRIEDANQNGIYDEDNNETKGYLADTDNDGLLDGVEDKNKNGVVDLGETNPRVSDSDGDGLPDGDDPCRFNPNTFCTDDKDCIPGVNNCPLTCVKGFIPSSFQDLDNDGIPDVAEDRDHDCFRDVGELDFESDDTDFDGIKDGIEDANANGIFDEGETDGTRPDTDGDGLNDGVEDKNKNGYVDVGETDPRVFNDASTIRENCIAGIPPENPKQDSDGDGLLDTIEDRNTNCKVDFGETDATKSDTDGDGISDGIEDKNHDGIQQENETSPIKVDSDGDGIEDGIEDRNFNGIREFTELNPLSNDTDGDGLFDWREDANLNGIFDEGETAGYLSDTDADGLLDGIEDVNLNGLVDPGETDPRNEDTDGDGAFDQQDANPIRNRSSDLNQITGKSNCSLTPLGVMNGTGFLTLGFGLLAQLFVCLGLKKRDK